MEAIKSLMSALCVSLIFFGLVLMLSPSGNIQKIFKNFLSVALVWTLVAVVSGADIKLGDIDLAYGTADGYQVSSKLNETVDDLNASVTEAAVELLIEERLSEFGVEDVAITAETDISDSNSISITKVHIICDYGDGEVCKREVGKLGFDVKVTERVK